VDECEDEVFRNLFKTIQSIHKHANVRFLMTARFITSIREMIVDELGAIPQLEVRASDADIRKYFTSRQPGFKNFLKNNTELCALASDKVVEAAGGMWVLLRPRDYYCELFSSITCTHTDHHTGFYTLVYT
jgi:hypothetical protein